MLAITYTKITKIKEAKWGTPKKNIKKKNDNINKNKTTTLKNRFFFRTYSTIFKAFPKNDKSYIKMLTY
jgi:hypothetical protein